MKKTVLLLGMILCVSTVAHGELVVYSDRPEARFSEAIKDFTAQTGETVSFVEGSYSDLIDRLEKEGTASPADMIITKDLVYLADLKGKNLLKSFEDTQRVRSVPSFMRASQNEWVAITFRARTVAYNPSLVSRSEITTYADLADPKWVGSLCLRTSKAAYNEALVSGLILKHSEEQAKDIVAGWVDNLAAAPMRNDTAVLEEIARGNCLLGIVNHYYFAGLKARNPNFPVEITFMDQSEEGVLTNGTAIALLKTADDQALAQAFMEILLTEKHQLAISGAHFDYPAVTNVVPDTLIKDWGSFKMNPLSWEEIGKKVSKARELMDQVGYE